MDRNQYLFLLRFKCDALVPLNATRILVVVKMQNNMYYHKINFIKLIALV